MVNLDLENTTFAHFKKHPKMGKKISADKCPKIHFYDLHSGTSNVFFGSDLTILSVFCQCSKMSKIGQKVKVNRTIFKNSKEMIFSAVSNGSLRQLNVFYAVLTKT